MKRIFEWIGGFALIAFSFYFTDRVSLLVANKSKLMLEIKEVSAEYEEKPTDAVINKDDNTIIPGKFGKKVNDEESYLNMHDFGSFNENFLIFDYIKPNKSLEDNKDKYITKGNPNNRKVSIILEEGSDLEEYFTVQEIPYNIIATKKSTLTSTKGELINGAPLETDFKKIHSYLEDEKHICIKEYSNETMCKKLSYYIVNPQIHLKNSNISEIKNQITPGSLILASKNTKLENIILILNEIKYKDLEIVYISNLIDEKAS